MRTYQLIALMLISFFSSTKSIGQTNDPVYDSVAQLNLNQLAGKPVDSLLHVIPQSYTDIGIWGVIAKNKARGLSIRYASGMTITVIPKVFIFMNPIDSNRIWNLTLFKKETAHYITVMHPDKPTLTGGE
ncbi:MAG: hypothetical protein JST86_03815 [Bacteroidetes bacterium]|nr:hypothetical protein [Bacteroidota bacterium]